MKEQNVYNPAEEVMHGEILAPVKKPETPFQVFFFQTNTYHTHEASTYNYYLAEPKEEELTPAEYIGFLVGVGIGMAGVLPVLACQAIIKRYAAEPKGA